MQPLQLVLQLLWQHRRCQAGGMPAALLSEESKGWRLPMTDRWRLPELLAPSWPRRHQKQMAHPSAAQHEGNRFLLVNQNQHGYQVVLQKYSPR